MQSDLSNDSLYEIMLNTDDQTLKSMCSLNKHALMIYKDDKFWENRYKLKYGEPKNKMFNWKKEYKLKYRSELPKRLYHLIYIDIDPTDIRSRYEIQEDIKKTDINMICSIYAKSEEKAYEMMTYMYNNNKLDLGKNIYYQNKTVEVSKPSDELTKEFFILLEQYNNISGKLTSFAKNHLIHPGDAEAIYQETLLMVANEIFYDFVVYYSNINMIYFKSTEEYRILILDIFKYLYSHNFKTELCPYIPDTITKPYISVDIFKEIIKTNYRLKCITGDSYNYI